MELGPTALDLGGSDSPWLRPNTVVFTMRCYSAQQPQANRGESSLDQGNPVPLIRSNQLVLVIGTLAAIATRIRGW